MTSNCAGRLTQRLAALFDEECCPASERLTADFEARRVALVLPLLKHEICTLSPLQ